MKYDLKPPIYFVGQTVNYLHHNKRMMYGKITYIETHYGKRDNDTPYGYHIYAIVNPNAKRSFWIGEQYVSGVIS